PPIAGPPAATRRMPAPEDSNRVIAAIADSWDHPRTMVGVSILLDWAAEHGCPPGDLLRGSRIDPELLPDPVELIEAHQELTVIRNLVEAFDDRPGLGVELSARYHLTAYGHFGYLLAACSSVHETVQQGLRY